MKNFLKSGKVVDYVAPANVSSGDPVLVGAALFGVANQDKLTGEIGSLEIEGVFELPKATVDVMAIGALVNFNNTTKQLQVATSDLDGCAMVVEEAAGNGDTTVTVKINP